MRTIKYKGYNKKNKKWLYGFYLQNRGAHFICPDEFANDKTWEDYEVDPESVCEFIGLTDAKDNDIYEKDLLELIIPDGSKRIFKVEFCSENRMLKELKGFIHDGNPIQITGFCFNWNGHRLYPSVIDGIPDNKKMTICGNSYNER